MGRQHLDLGAEGEDRAAAWYSEKGYTVLARNWRCADGELDLVVCKDGIVVFCEVKTRATDRWGLPAEAVNQTKQRRLRHLAVLFLKANRVRSRELRFDVASVLPSSVTVIEAAF